MEPFTLVVMECGSDWPARMPPTSNSHCVVLSQERNEPQSALLRRTYDRIRAIELGGGIITLAILSCNNDTGRRALEARVPLARALLATIIRADEARLLLVAGSSAPDRTRYSLTALAGTLTGALVGSSASVSALFGASEISFPRYEAANTHVADVLHLHQTRWSA